MGLPQGWRETAGSPKVTVAVADTGLDYTHSELGPKFAQVIDLTVLEGEEPICKTCSASPTRTWRPSSAGRPTATGTATAPGSAATP
jgi:hypothetical protein